MDDDALLEESRRGGTVALESLLCRHLSTVRAFARVRMGAELRTHDELSDVVQSACREVLADAAQFEYRGEKSFRAWLCLQVERKLQDRARYWKAERRDARREAHKDETPSAASQPFAELSDVYAALHSPSKVAQGRELVERVEAGFERLSEHDRELVVLSRIAGLSIKELAAHIGRDEHSTRTLLSRALARLAGFVDV